MITRFDQLIAQAGEKKGVVIGVPRPEDETSIRTVLDARGKKLADFILAGDRAKIIRLIRQMDGDEKQFEIIETSDSDEHACARLVELAVENRLHVILKGFVSTSALMKPILAKQGGLRTGRLLSDILIVENPCSRQPELLGMTDGGLNILPGLEEKKAIIENGVQVFHTLGYPRPRVGLMAAYEKVNEKMPATVHAAELTRMNERGEIAGCTVYGPLALDIAVSATAAQNKGIDHPVAGHVQIMVVPNIESGNLLGKAFTYYLDIPVAHVVMGAKIPILIPSRNESETDKIHSIALGAIIAEN